MCAQASDAVTAMAEFRATIPDLVIVDISLPGMSGLELMEMMRSEAPRARILVLSMHEERTYAIRALKAGARGYITKAEAMSSIVTALRSVAAGDIYLSPAFAGMLIFKTIAAVAAGRPTALDVLSKRECEVLEWMGKGASTNAIARELQLSPKTVETHRAHIKEKLHLGDSARLVRFAADWVESGDLVRAPIRDRQADS